MKNIRILALVVLAAVCLFPLLLAADDAPAKAEAPPQEAGGLKLEINVVNAPLYPGDDLQVDVRLTNVQKEGDIQIIDFPILDVTMHPVAIGPDGQQITWPALAVSVKPPGSPTATLPPGGFYGRKITLDATQMRKPGKYAISVRYNNADTLKDKGFNCWTGNLQSNTAFFEVPDFSNVPAVDGIQMLVKAKPQYREDEPITIEVRLYNSADKEVEVYSLSDEFLSALSTGLVKDEKGNEIKWRYQPIKNFIYTTTKLAPATAETMECNLRDVCDLPVGKYTLQLHSKIPLNKKGEDIKLTSNEVTFEIIPTEKPAEPAKKPEAPLPTP